MSRDSAASLRELADRLGAIDVEGDEGGVRAAEEALRRHAQRLDGIDGTGEALEIHRIALEELGRALESAARSLEAEQSARAIDRMRLAESLRGLAHDAERGVHLAAQIATLDHDVEGLRADLRAQGEALASLRAESALREEALRREIAARDAQLQQQRDHIGRLEATLGEAGHRVVTRVGELAARHPAVASVLRAPVRWLSRLLQRRGP
jgi:chromosome segregation ATPase